MIPTKNSHTFTTGGGALAQDISSASIYCRLLVGVISALLPAVFFGIFPQSIRPGPDQL
jgi:hypothetical protein